MLTNDEILELSRKKQTSKINILREYIQSLFLSYFYQQKGSENFLFKGGTALKIVYNSPRFSEDLDFSGVKNGGIYEKIIERVVYLISNTGEIGVDIVESKSTTGGWIGVFLFSVGGEKIKITNEISYRKRNIKGDFVLVSSDLVPPFSVFVLNQKFLVEEKISALIYRAKPRDVFDLYFILRNNTLRRFYDSSKNKEVSLALKRIKEEDIRKELSNFLPSSYRVLLKDLRKKIVEEL